MVLDTHSRKIEGGYFAPKGSKPPAAGARKRRDVKPIVTPFRKLYDRGDFPLSVTHNSNGNHLSWKVPLSTLDYHTILPLFFTGLSETLSPYSFIAHQGVHDLLTEGQREGNEGKVLGVVPQLIMPLKEALNTRNPAVIGKTLKVLQRLVEVEGVGLALVPYYRQILPMFDLFKNVNQNLGDGIYYAQQRRENLGDLIQETLALFEKSGGDDAFVNIKYLVPTYESICK